jgi:metallo-beta-lactamase family protein
MSDTRITFLGAAGTVTGSRHLLETHGKRLLIDCGLFQGTKENRLKNWDGMKDADGNVIDPATIDTVLLTHAHVDHIGYLPRLVKEGFHGDILCSTATAELAKILLMDTAHLQEEEARWANKKGYSKHSPALPLFTRQDAERVFPLFKPIPYGTHFEPAPGVRGKFRDVGHILGAAFIDLKTTQSRTERKIVFSGDVGRPTDTLLRPPAQAYNVNYLVMESTYGDRLHEHGDPVDRIVDAINVGLNRGGVILVPAFAVGRAQMLLYVLREMQESGRISAKIPIYLDSPMAVEALNVHRANVSDLNLFCRKQSLHGIDLFRPQNLHLAVTREESQKINNVKENAIIISSSGMMAGGRILHHLQKRLPDERNTVLIIGYQAEGTRGRSLVDGKEEIKMFGEMVPVKAHLERIEGFSGHADYEELLAWILGFNMRPERIFIVHGEGGASRTFASSLHKHFDKHWQKPLDITVPTQGFHALLEF